MRARSRRSLDAAGPPVDGGLTRRSLLARGAVAAGTGAVAASGKKDDNERASGEAVALSHLMKGVHW